MSTLLDRMNLRPQERRVVVLFGALIFLVLNYMFVWPRFGDWKQFQAKTRKARETLELYQAESRQVGLYQANLQSLEGAGAVVLPDDQAIQLQRTYQSQAAQSGVIITGTSRLTTKTNENFLEQVVTISIQSGEKQLVDFLHSLGTGNSMIRVRELSLRPDANRYQLAGNITLAASYERKAPARPEAAVPAASSRTGEATAPKRPPSPTRAQPETSKK